MKWSVMLFFLTLVAGCNVADNEYYSSGYGGGYGYQPVPRYYRHGHDWRDVNRRYHQHQQVYVPRSRPQVIFVQPPRPTNYHGHRAVYPQYHNNDPGYSTAVSASAPEPENLPGHDTLSGDSSSSTPEQEQHITVNPPVHEQTGEESGSLSPEQQAQSEPAHLRF